MQRSSREMNNVKDLDVYTVCMYKVKTIHITS